MLVNALRARQSKKKKTIKIKFMENQNLGGAALAPQWQLNLVEEREALLQKTINLKNTLDDKKGLKLSNREWQMLQCQFNFMRDYLQILTDRCVYYGLIKSGELGIHY